MDVTILCNTVTSVCASQGSVCDRWQGHLEADHHQWLARGSLCGWNFALGPGLPVHWQTWRRWVKEEMRFVCFCYLLRAFSGINTHCWIYGPHGDHRTALIQQNMISAVLGKVRVWFRLSTMRRSQYRNIPAAPTFFIIFFYLFFLKASDVIYFICITTFHIYSMYIFWGRSYFKWVCL